jgi:hypothetical protein
MGPKQKHSTVLSVEEETLIVAFRKHTLLPLDGGQGRAARSYGDNRAER